MIDFNTELQKLSTQHLDHDFLKSENDIADIFNVFNDSLAKIFKRQSETGMQVEEMYSILEETDNSDEISELVSQRDKLINGLISSADLIESFYLYYETNYDEVLSEQSALMWKSLCKSLSSIGVNRIADEQTAFDANLNTIETVISNFTLPHGHIIEVLKSGYIYNNIVYRKSIVVVNKLEVAKNE